MNINKKQLQILGLGAMGWTLMNWAFCGDILKAIIATCVSLIIALSAIYLIEK